MHRHLLFLLVLTLGGLTSCAVTSAHFPAPFVGSIPSADIWPDAGAVVVEDNATLYFRTPPHARSAQTAGSGLAVVIDHHRRLKILRESGLAAAHVELPLSALTSVDHLIARSVSARGRSVTMPLSAVEKTATSVCFTIPNAEVGGFIEYRYERTYLEPSLAPPWVFGGLYPVIRAEFNIVTDPAVQFDYRYGRNGEIVDALPQTRTLDDKHTRLLFVEQDIPAYYAEELMPHLSAVAPWIAVVPTTANLGEQPYRLQTWEDVARRARELQDHSHSLDLFGSLAERYKRVRDGAIQPNNAASLLLAGLGNLREVKKASLVLVSGPMSPQVIDGMPALYPFTRTMVAVEGAGDVSYLDPACRYCAMGEIASEYTGARALVVHQDGTVEWRITPVDVAQHNRLSSEFHGSMEIDGHLVGRLTGTASGAFGRHILADIHTDPDPETGAYDILELLGLEGKDIQVAFTGVAEKEQHDGPVSFNATFEADADHRGDENYRLRVAEIFGSAFAGEWRSSRRYAAVLDAPFWVETTATIELPPGYQMDQRPPVIVVTPFAEYAAGFILDGRTLKFSRRLVVKVHEVAARDWRAARDFVEQVRALESGGVGVWMGDVQGK